MRTQLRDGSRVGILGGGPAGSFFAYFLLEFARRMDLILEVDVYEPRDFSRPGSAGCNMCGGIVSESLVQALAVEGINLPASVVQRGIDGYVLHTERDEARITTPRREKRIAAVHRGGGPRDQAGRRWASLDGFLLKLAESRGARVIRARVRDVGWEGERPQVLLSDAKRAYDLLVGATGVNSNSWRLFEQLGLPSRAPRTTRTYITELQMRDEDITESFGSSMHLFLLDDTRVDCAAIIPKGSFVTVCLLGREIDSGVVDAFFSSSAVARCFPGDFVRTEVGCHCSPRINEREASVPFMDRVVLVGDCGVTRLYKDGIGAAYRTAKTAARTAVFSGVSARDFRKHYWTLYRSIARDNNFGRAMFAVVHGMRSWPLLLEGVSRTVAREQNRPERARRMSIVLWDMFTGSAPYRDVFCRTLDPRFLMGFLWQIAGAIWKRRERSGHGRGGARPGVQRRGAHLPAG